MKRRDIVKKLREAGFEIREDGGRHAKAYKDGVYVAAIPRHTHIKTGTVRAIERQTGVKLI